MNAPSERPLDDAMRQRALELDRLNERCALARQALEQVQAELTFAQQRLDLQSMRLLRDANEALVQSALQAQQRVEARERELGQAVRTLGLDALTQLPNRLLLRDRFLQAAAAVRRHGGHMAVLFVDLDRFKRINDLYGHGAGDRALYAVARALASAVRESDTVSRYGGDEFVVLLSHLADPADATAIARKVVEALAALHGTDGESLQLSASIGIAIHPDDGDDLETLIERADAAMYRSKRTRSPLWRSLDEAQASPGVQTPAPALDGAADASASGAGAAEPDALPLRDVNERLVMAVLSARDAQLAAENAFRVQQTNLAVTAHELRNPLAPLSYAVALLRSVPGREPILASVRGILERQVEHMARLVGDLLDVSRASTGKLHIERTEIDLIPLVNAAVQASLPAMQRRHQAVELASSPPSLQVRGDAVRLAQVFSNLLDNASKFTPDGGSIRFEVTLEADEVVLTVSDSGIGISAELLPHVFEAFVQEGSSPSPLDVGGMGIGLMLVQQLVQAHGGSVEARSGGRDRGSVFVVRLPAVAPVA